MMYEGADDCDGDSVLCVAVSRVVLRLVAGDEGARVVLYAGQAQGDRIVSHGPFIGDSKEDIVRLYTEYRAGRFERLSTLARSVSVA